MVQRPSTEQRQGSAQIRDIGGTVWKNLVGWVRQESAATTALIQAFIALGIAFEWWHWSPAQTGAVIGIVAALLGMFVRSQVTPIYRLRPRAGQPGASGFGVSDGSQDELDSGVRVLPGAGPAGRRDAGMAGGPPPIPDAGQPTRPDMSAPGAQPTRPDMSAPGAQPTRPDMGAPGAQPTRPDAGPPAGSNVSPGFPGPGPRQ